MAVRKRRKKRAPKRRAKRSSSSCNPKSMSKKQLVTFHRKVTKALAGHGKKTLSSTIVSELKTYGLTPRKKMLHLPNPWGA